MGLSKSRRVRNTAALAGSNELCPSLAYALRFLAAQGTSTRAVGKTVRQAVQLRVWIEGMQKQLLLTAAALRDNPATVLSPFQKACDDFVLPQPSFAARVAAFCLDTARTVHQWLMHPLIDTRF